MVKELENLSLSPTVLIIFNLLFRSSTRYSIIEPPGWFREKPNLRYRTSSCLKPNKATKSSCWTFVLARLLWEWFWGRWWG